MPTRKNTSKTSSQARLAPLNGSAGGPARSVAPPKASGRRRTRRAKPHAAHAGRRQPVSFDPMKYAVPGAALATGMLAVAGYMIRDRVADVLQDLAIGAKSRAASAAVATGKLAGGVGQQAMHAVDKLTDQLSFDALLKHAGLARRNTLMSFVAPALGVACGFVAGSVVTYFFGPKLIEQMKAAVANDTHTEQEEPAMGETRVAASDYGRPNDIQRTSS